MEDLGLANALRRRHVSQDEGACGAERQFRTLVVRLPLSHTSTCTYLASDVAKPSVVPRILTSMEIHGHAEAALLGRMKDARGCGDGGQLSQSRSRCGGRVRTTPKMEWEQLGCVVR